MKICYSCAVEKPLEEFHRHRGRRDGYNDVCKICAGKRVSLYARTDGARAVRAKYFAEYKERNREKIQDYFRDYQRNMSPEQKEKRDKTKRRKYRLSPRYVLYTMLYSASKRRPTENIATVEDLMEMYEAQCGLCAVSKIRMTWGAGNGGRKQTTSISLDRIDGSRGYEKENLRLVCWQVNLFKNCWSDAEMLTMARAIVDNMQRTSREPSWQPYVVLSEVA